MCMHTKGPITFVAAFIFCITAFWGIYFFVSAPPLVSPIASEAFAKELDKKIPTPTTTPTPTPTPIPTSTPTPTPLPTATPTPIKSEPTPQPPLSIPVSSQDLENHFSKYSSEYGIDKELLKRIAACESGFNTNSRNGDYGGMYQFASSSWQSTRASMGMDQNTDLRFNAEESIRTAAFKISRGGSSAWPSCAR